MGIGGARSMSASEGGRERGRSESGERVSLLFGVLSRRYFITLAL